MIEIEKLFQLHKSLYELSTFAIKEEKNSHKSHLIFHQSQHRPLFIAEYLNFFHIVVNQSVNTLYMLFWASIGEKSCLCVCECFSHFIPSVLIEFVSE